MSAIATAIIGSAVVGGIVSNNAAHDAAAASDRATTAQENANAANLAFQQQQYDDWQGVYGPIQDKLSSYYQGLDSATFAASGLQKYEQEFQATQKNLRRSFAQRGVSSDAQALLEQDAALNKAEAKAGVRANAPLQVAQMQQGFLTGQIVNPNSAGISNAYGNQATMYGNQAIANANNAAIANAATGRAIVSGMQALPYIANNSTVDASIITGSQPGAAGQQSVVPGSNPYAF